METIPLRQTPLQILPEEIEIINDIRRINFGKVTVVVQNGVIISKEVTTITKNSRNKNGFNGNGNGNGNGYKQEGFDRARMEVFIAIIAIGILNMIAASNGVKEVF